MSARPFAIVLLLVAVASAVVSWNRLASVMVGACAACLVAGLVWKRVTPTLLAGLLLYPVLAVALTAVLPVIWSFLASGLFVIAICERMTFEYEVSTVLESPTGVDAETRLRVSEVSRAHARRISL